jgi:hypothetical protein
VTHGSNPKSLIPLQVRERTFAGQAAMSAFAPGCGREGEGQFQAKFPVSEKYFRVFPLAIPCSIYQRHVSEVSKISDNFERRRY